MKRRTAIGATSQADEDAAAYLLMGEPDAAAAAASASSQGANNNFGRRHFQQQEINKYDSDMVQMTIDHILDREEHNFSSPDQRREIESALKRILLENLKVKTVCRETGLNRTKLKPLVKAIKGSTVLKIFQNSF